MWSLGKGEWPSLGCCACKDLLNKILGPQHACQLTKVVAYHASAHPPHCPWKLNYDAKNINSGKSHSLQAWKFPPVNVAKWTILKLNIVHYVRGSNIKGSLCHENSRPYAAWAYCLVMLWSSPSHDHLYNIHVCHIKRMCARIFTCQKIKRKFDMGWWKG